MKLLSPYARGAYGYDTLYTGAGAYGAWRTDHRVHGGEVATKVWYFGAKSTNDVTCTRVQMGT